MNPHSNVPVTRRRLLQGAGTGIAAGLVAACAPAAAPAPAPAPAPQAQDNAFQRQWDDLVKAAKAEGKVQVFLSGSEGFLKIGRDFEAAFPGITVELTALSTASLFLPKILAERAAGIYAWDVLQVQPPFSLGPNTLRPNGALEPMRPLLFHPEVLDDKAWPGGAENNWIDYEKRWQYAYAWGLIGAVWINTDLVKDGEIKSVKDLLDPKWKGKIISADPRTHGQGFIPATIISLRYGNDILKQIWVDQEVALSRDTRQITEGLVRGKYAAAIGVTPADLQRFLDEGAGKNVKGLFIDSSAPLLRSITLANKAPHPNAAKLFLNWFLTKEGQTSWAKNTLLNSRRRDVQVVDPPTWVDPDKQHPILLEMEATMDKILATAEHMKKIIQ